MQRLPIIATVGTLAGESLELKLPSHATVAKLKATIEEAWQIPVLFQKLIFGERVLCDPEQLSDHCGSDLDLYVTLLLCSDAARHALEGKGVHRTIQALEAIKRLGLKAGEIERCAVEGQLHNSCSRIRVAAVAALGNILSDTDVYRISLLGQCLADPCSRVRSAAVSKLSQLASKQDNADCIFAALSAQLQHPEASVRRSAVCAASRCKGKLDMRKVWAAVNLMLESSMSELRATALEVLSQVAERGDQEVLSAVLAKLTDAEACVRCAALAALGCLASSKGDWCVVGPLLTCLEDADDDVRQAAHDQLPRLVSKNDARTIQKVAKCLEHEDAGVRLDVPVALLRVASRGNACTFESVASRLAHLSCEVRQASVSALEHLARGMEDEAALVVTPYLEHEQPETRAAAVQLLCTCGTDVTMTIKKLTDQDEGVRNAAIDGIARLASLDDPGVIDGVSKLLGSSHAGIRLAALNALRRIVTRGNKQVIPKISSCLKDTSPEMQLAAVDALAQIANPEDSLALSALRSCRQSVQTRQRELACAVYGAETKIRSRARAA
eukprot:TRINITY_DN20777_c0_g1_i1.p1 TRINITY_DN20777_c0_g1~~TRINITY_DN20777_c0_g1_i1.p1  ORF type:complete len:556 (+),score=89.86 TRINITY_DN20777_c0_g1_i1:48-1715(+)